MVQAWISRQVSSLLVMVLTAATPAFAGPIVLDANGVKDVNNLRQISLALQNYHDTFKSFPGAFTGTDASPLLSWRVALLPFLGETALYQQFDLTKAWDDPVNASLLTQMPSVYRSPVSAAGSTTTNYVGVMGPGTMFQGAQGVSINSVSDGTSNTLFVGETQGTAIPWTTPQDILLTTLGSCATLAGSGFSSSVASATPFAFVDGRVGFLPNDLSCQTLQALFVRSDGQIVDSQEMGYVDGTVPEPGAVVLLGTGLVLMTFLKRRIAGRQSTRM